MASIAELLGKINEEELAAMELGITVERYRSLRDAYADTYKHVTPIEGAILGTPKNGVYTADRVFVGTRKRPVNY